MGVDLSSSMEDYLEAIAILKRRDGVVRVKSISRFVGVEPPSVASALNVLSKNGLVIHERYGYVDLTPRGKQLAEKVEKKHKLILEFLTGILNIDPVVAREDACKMEHDISEVTLEGLAKFVEFVLTCPQGIPEWLKNFGYYMEHAEHAEECRTRCHR